MINNKEDYLYYRKCDQIALRRKNSRPKMFSDEIYRFEILLRKFEYYTNCRKDIIGRLIKIIVHFKFKRLSLKLGFTIPINCFGPGLSIAHYGTIVVAQNAHIGANCRIHEGVNIGGTNGSDEAATIGDNVFIGAGVKIIGQVKIADNVAIGSNAVIVKDILESGITVGGVPAKKISNNDSSSNLVRATEIVNKMN